MLAIGHVNLSSPLLLAPMAGISDLPFRLINRSLGCGFAFTEMISARSLTFKNKRTLKMLASNTDDRPLGVQILGNDPEIIKRALDIISGYAFDIIDFNAACPVPKVVSKGEGAALLRDPVKLQHIMHAVVESSAVPITVKLRSGWDHASVNAVEVSLRAQDAGVRGVILHGRTKMQGYKERVDYGIIRKVKQSIQIPVIASGDALTPDLIKKMFDETGCDGVAIARGALGNPWIFQNAARRLDNTETLRPGIDDITRTMREHLELLVQFHGERTGIVRFRKLFLWYTKGLPVRRLRAKVCSVLSRDEMLQLIEEIGTSREP